MSPSKLFMVFTVVSSLSHAQTFTWDGGGGDDNFGTGANWNPDGAPSVGSGVVLRFIGGTRTTPNNNYTSGDDFGEWRLFTGATSDFTIGGNAIDLFSKIEVEGGVNRNLTLNLSAINAGANIELNPVGGNITVGSGTAIELHNNRTLNVYDGNNNRTLTINGTLSNGNGSGGNGSLILNQTSTVVLAGNSNDYGNTTINGGTTLRVGDGSANGSLGSGTVSNSGTLIFNRGSGSSYNQGATVTGTGTFRVQSGTVVGTAAASFGGSGAKVDIQSGGAINLNGVNRGSNLFDVTLAGTGNGGSGAIFNSGGAVYSNSGIRSVTLAANATVNVAGSGEGNRFDFRSDGTLNLAGFNLTKEGGGNLVITSTPGSTGTMTVSAGTLAFEANFTGAGTSGYNVSVASGAAVGGYNGRTINSTVTLNGTTAAIYSHGSAASTWAGNVVLNGGGLIDLSNRVYPLSSGDSVNVTGVVSGNGGLNVSGANNLRYAILTNTGNSFTGGVTVSGDNSVLRVPSDAALGPTSNTVTLQNGGRLMNGNTGSGVSFSLDAARAINLASGIGRFHVWGGQTLTVPGTISGPGNLAKTDGGLLVLSGSNTYGGYTHIEGASQLRIDANQVIPSTSSVLIYGNSTFNVNGRTQSVAGLHVGSSVDTTATVQLGSGANLTVTGTSMPGGSPTNIGGDFYAKITGTGNITYNHSSNAQANWTWRNTANDFTGNITITSGRIQALETSLGNAANDIIFNGDVVSTLNNGEGKASLQVTNGTSLTLNSGRTITLNSGKEGTMYVWSSTTTEVLGQITGGGNLRKEDGGTLRLSNTSNNYTGQTKLVLGTLTLGAAGVLPDATEVVIANATLNLNGFNETVTALSSGGFTNGIISGNGGTLFVNGSGNYTYTGRVTDSIGGANNGGIVAYNGAGSLTLSGTQDNSGGRARVDSGTLILAKSSTGSVHAVGTNNTPALFINGGTLQLGGTGNDQIYTEANVQMIGGTFDMNGRNEGFRGLTGSAGTIVNNGGGASALIIGESSTSGDTYTFSGTFGTGSGVVNLTKRGGGTQVLDGASTFTGTVTVMDGGVVSVPAIANIGVAQPLGAGASPIALQAGSSLLFTGATGSTDRGLALSGVNGGIVNVPTGTLTVSGGITGASSNLTKAGAGTFNLSGSGAWTGDFFISGGTFNVTSTGSIGGVGVTELTGGATLDINTSTQVRTASINLVDGTVNLNAGTLRTNGITMASGTAFNWSAGTLTMQTDAAGNSGFTDRRTPGSSLSTQSVYEGRIITFAGPAAAITMPAGSVLDLGPTYGSFGMRYDQLSIAGSLDLSSADNTLHFEFNPFFFRPSAYGADAAGTLILVDSNGFTGTFENFTGVVSDYLGFSAAPGSGSVVGTLGMSSLNPLTDIPVNTYYLEYETDSGNVLFHYRLSATIPEPASAGLMVAGLVLLRALRRRRG